MVDRSQDYSVTDEDVITNVNTTLILELAARINEHMLTDMDVPAEVIIERRKEPEGRIDLFASIRVIQFKYVC